MVVEGTTRQLLVPAPEGTGLAWRNTRGEDVAAIQAVRSAKRAPPFKQKKRGWSEAHQHDASVIDREQRRPCALVRNRWRMSGNLV